MMLFNCWSGESIVGQARAFVSVRDARTATAPVTESVAHQRRTPGEATAERLQQQQLAAADAAVAYRDIERQRHRCRGGVAVLLNRDDHPFHRHLELAGRRLDDAD